MQCVRDVDIAVGLMLTKTTIEGCLLKASAIFAFTIQSVIIRPQSSTTTSGQTGGYGDLLLESDETGRLGLAG